jgi:HD-like signal output (HDOD) protein
LLHDIGKLIIACNMPSSYGRLLEADQANKLSIQMAEMKIFGATHEQIGAYLIGLWGLPDSIVETVAFHHVPDQYPACAFDALGAVHIADAIEHMTAKTGRDAMEQRLSKAYLERFGLKDRLDDWIDLNQEAAAQG